jgi:CHAD domain-containing protein
MTASIPSPRQPAGGAVCDVLKGLLRRMQENEAGVIAGRDPECLHRYRVALRRTRSCLGQLKRSLPEDRLGTFKPEFAWLGSVTGPRRDLDVFLLDMKRYRKRFDAASRRSFEPLLELIDDDRRREHDRLVAELDTERYRSLVTGWRAFLDAPVRERDAPQAGLPIAEVVVERIRSSHERVLRRGRGIDAMKATGRLHRLRIDAKKLRYLLEFFRDLFPSETVKPLIVTLKRLQDHLGKLNDLVVQQSSLSNIVSRLESGGNTPATTFVTVGRLLQRLSDEERRTRRRFAVEWKRFDDEKTAHRIARLAPASRLEASS